MFERGAKATTDFEANEAHADPDDSDYSRRQSKLDLHATESKADDEVVDRQRKAGQQ